jgi:hypothetical protein
MPTAEQYNQWAGECDRHVVSMRKVADPVINAFTSAVMKGPKANSVKAKMTEGDRDFGLAGTQVAAMGRECRTRAGVCSQFQIVWNAWRERQAAHINATNAYNAAKTNFDAAQAAYTAAVDAFNAAQAAWSASPEPRGPGPTPPTPPGAPPAPPAGLDPEPQPPASWVEIHKY